MNYKISFSEMNQLANKANSKTAAPQNLNLGLGLILEDIHDENVICSNGILYFIDTVFYLTQKFYLTKNS